MRPLRILFLSLLFLSFPVRAQDNADATPSDSIVRATVMVASPDYRVAQSVFGHAFVRMQYPAAGLDYCFSFESAEVQSFLSILTGGYRIRMACVPTGEYLQQFIDAGRRVEGCGLNITRSEGQQLWRILDETCQIGDYPYHDYFHHGCSQELCNVLFSCFRDELDFSGVPTPYGNNIFNIGTRNLEGAPWTRFLCALSGGVEACKPLSEHQQMILPSLLLSQLAAVRVVGAGGVRSLLVHPRPVTYVVGDGGAVQQSPSRSLSVPLVLTLLLLALSLLVSVCHVAHLVPRRVTMPFDVLLLALHTAVVVLLLSLNLFSSLSVIKGFNYNLIIYNPLPILLLLCAWCRRWGSKAQSSMYLLFSGMCVLYIVAILLTDCYIAEQILLAAAFLIRSLASYAASRHC